MFCLNALTASISMFFLRMIDSYDAYREKVNKLKQKKQVSGTRVFHTQTCGFTDLGKLNLLTVD